MYYVYMATNLKTNKKYIGITKRTLEARAYNHYVYARTRAKASKFAAALNESSKEDWKWEVIDTAETEDQAKLLEVSYVTKYDSHTSGYNSTIGGEGSYGRELSEETRKRISESNTGKEVSEETRKKLSLACKGRVLSEDDKKNKSIAARNRVYKSESGYKGIKPIKKKGEIVGWKAIFNINRRCMVSLGKFATIEEAVAKWNAANEEFKETGQVTGKKWGRLENN